MRALPLLLGLSIVTAAPARAGESPPFGHLDPIDAALVTRGWALDPDTPNDPIDVEFWIDGGLVDTESTTVPRPDVNAVYSVTGTHGFAWPVPLTYLDGSPHSLVVVAKNVPSGSDVPVVGSPVFFQYDESQHTEYSYHVSEFEISGAQTTFVDDFSDGLLPPWVIDGGRPEDTGAGLQLAGPGTFLYASDNFMPGAAIVREVSSAVLNTTLSDAAGDFTVRSRWTDGAPPTDQLYGLGVSISSPSHIVFLSIWNIGPEAASYTAAQLPPGIHLSFREVSWTSPAPNELDATSYGDDTTGHLVTLEPSAFTGDVLLEVSFDDDLDTLSARFSTDGGSTWNESLATHTATGLVSSKIRLVGDPRLVAAAAALPATGWKGRLLLGALLAGAGTLAMGASRRPGPSRAARWGRQGVYSTWTRRSRRAFAITETELRLMAAAAIMGLRSSPTTG